MITKIYMSWEDFGIALEELIEDIKSFPYKLYDGVYGIPRGG